MMDMVVIRGCLGKVGRKCEDGEVESRAKKRCLCLFINHARGHTVVCASSSSTTRRFRFSMAPVGR